jgi:hypothetical protein
LKSEVDVDVIGEEERVEKDENVDRKADRSAGTSVGKKTVLNMRRRRTRAIRVDMPCSFSTEILVLSYPLLSLLSSREGREDGRGSRGTTNNACITSRFGRNVFEVVEGTSMVVHREISTGAQRRRGARRGTDVLVGCVLLVDLAVTVTGAVVFVVLVVLLVGLLLLEPSVPLMDEGGKAGGAKETSVGGGGVGADDRARKNRAEATEMATSWPRSMYAHACLMPYLLAV